MQNKIVHFLSESRMRDEVWSSYRLSYECLGTLKFWKVLL